MPAMGEDISLQGTAVRIGLGVALVLATFNPTGYSLAHWITAPPVSVSPGKAVAALVLLTAWLVCLRTAFIALGKWGMALGVALFAAIIWLLVDRNWLTLTGSAFVWAVLVVVGLLLGIGLSWSLVRAKATGQIEVR